MCDLKGQTALITGGAQGIGFGIALELARAGSRVIVADRNLPGARAAAEKIEQGGHAAIAVALDVTNEGSIRDGVRSALDRFSCVDILVNNAGIHCENLNQPSTVEHFNRCFDVNVFGIWRMVQGLAPHFKAHRGGKIVNIASVNARKPWPGTPAYSASKAAVINLTQSLAITLAPDNINVNAVCPGGVMTPMADQFLQDVPSLSDDMLRDRALHRPLLPEDIGHAVVFFASAQARNITGQALNVDCGGVMS